MARKKQSEHSSDNEPIQYVPPEEKKTVVESPPREEPREGKEGGEPECFPDKRPPQCTTAKQR
jgi:hypothetical protein